MSKDYAKKSGRTCRVTENMTTVIVATKTDTKGT